jgi:high-affinity K+ transport system ATPase subunit B
VPSEEVRVGETVRVRPGDRIPLDGVVSDGRVNGQPGGNHRRVDSGGVKQSVTRYLQEP